MDKREECASLLDARECASDFGHVYSDDGLCRRCGAARPEACAICGKGFADPEDYFRHATGEPVHMTCYDRMWTH